MKNLGFGSEESCYLYNDIVIKHFDMVPHKNYTVQSILQFKDIDFCSCYIIYKRII